MATHANNLKSLTKYFLLIATTITINPASSLSDYDNPSAKCSESDKDALLAFKSNISKDTTGFLATWTKLSDPCSGGWAGVTCSSAGMVTQLTIQIPPDAGGYMKGSLSPFLGKLYYLDTLIIAGTKRIGGNIPESFSGLTRLTALVLDDNTLGGPIPSILGRLSNLNALSLNGNRLRGQIPHALGELRNLSALGLARNFLTGPIPTSLHTGLQFLDLSFNSLSGQLPDFIGQFHNITNLILTGNQLSGPIPDSLWGLGQLSELSIEQNQLTGQLPVRIGNLTSVGVLRLNGNALEGRIPGSQLAHLKNLWDLNLSRNAFTGAEFNRGLPPSLSSLDLSYNNLAFGDVPKWIKDSQKLTTIGLADCGLIGSVPVFAKPNSLIKLDLSSNGFTGSIFNFLERMPYLEHVNLSNNLLQGDLSTIRLPAQISVIDLSSNRLSGSPSGLLGNETSSWLQVLDVSRNDISGGIMEFKTGLGLKVLNLGGNNISGPIPGSISRVTELERLDISRNRVSGLIPRGLSTLRKLQWLDLSNNRLMGKIPAIKTLKHLNLRNNMLSGRIPQSPPMNIFKSEAYSGNKYLCGKPLGPC